MELFPEKIRKLWNGWEVRVVVVLSLLLQVILIIFGNRRKITVRRWIGILVWSAYLTADWVATVALGNLATSSSSQGETEDPAGSQQEPNDVLLQSFWAPFLLLHLGGPDTITAYSLEDNELWSRHFLGLVVQVGVAFYIFLQSWSNSALTFIAIPMFITGIIRYGERTLALRASSTENYKDSLSLNPDTCEDLVIIRSEELEDPSRKIVPKDGIDPKDNYLALAYFLFKRFEFVFAGRTLPSSDWTERFSVVIYKEPQDAFKLIELELGFLYDVLYTKASVVYSRLGIFLRCISFISCLSALIVFSVTIDIQAYLRIDIFITFLLLVGAVILEVYAFMVLFFSAWTKLWLIKRKVVDNKPVSRTDLVNRFWRFSSNFHSVWINQKWWSGSMGQFNLINFCLRDARLAGIRVEKLPYVGELLENYRYLTREDVNSSLQQKIFNHLKRKVAEIERLQKVNSLFHVQARDEVLGERGGYAIKKSKRFNTSGIRWSIFDVEFDTSLILLHIATDLCYCHHLNDILKGDSDKLESNCRISKCLSDYMLYLLLFRSSMIPKFVGEIRYKDTCDAAMEFFKKKKEQVSDKSKFHGRKALLHELLQEPAGKKTNLSVLRDACELANRFIKAASENPGDQMWKRVCGLARNLIRSPGDQHHASPSEELWETISEVWLEMLVYAANHCGWMEHAQQLVKGGELLTHVCLLMTHFGLTKQYVKKNN